MQVRKGYKQTEVGVIPSEWDMIRLGDKTVKVGSGITPTGGERVYKKEGRPFLRSQNVGWGVLISDDITYIDDETHETFKSTEIKLNDVFLNITGASIGRSAVADEKVVNGNVNQHVCIIRTKNDELNPFFLNYFLLSKQGQKQVDSFQAGGNRQGLNFGQIKSFLIPCPSIPEQTAIATALSDADALNSSLEKLIAKKRLIKQGAMQQLLTGKKRLPGFIGKWEEILFGDAVDLRKERIDQKKNNIQLFCIELEHLEQGTGRLLGDSNPGEQLSLKSVFYPDDVLFGKLRAYLKKYWLADRRGVCSTEIWVFMAKKQQITANYLFHIITTNKFIEVASTAYGTHMPRSDWGVVKNYEILLPPIPEQTAIAQILSDMDTEIESLEKKLSKYRLIKQGMMQELLTGKTRLV